MCFYKLLTFSVKNLFHNPPKYRTSTIIANKLKNKYAIPFGFKILIFKIFNIETPYIDIVNIILNIFNGKIYLNKYIRGKINAVYVTGKPI